MEEPAELHVHHSLSDGEREVLRLVSRGLTDEEIAQSLEVGLLAVRSRLQRFRDRTGLSGRQLVAWTASHLECCLAG